MSEIFDETGTLFYRGDNEDPEMGRNRPPITQLNMSVRDALQSMIELYNHYAQQIREVSGVNEYKEGTNTSPKTLVGVQAESIKASNNATAAIDNAFHDIIERSAERTIEFLQDVVKNSEAKKRYERILGTDVIEILERVGDVPIDMIAVTLEFEPTIEEQAILNKHVEVALSKELIELEDSLMIRDIDNIKLAIRVLVQKKKKRAETIGKMRQAAEQKKLKDDEMETQRKMKEISGETNIKSQSDIALYTAKANVDYQLKQRTAKIEMSMVQQEIDGKIRVAMINAEASSGKATMMEDRKDSRDKSQKTMESKLIEQRKDRLPEQDFTVNDEEVLNKRVTSSIEDNPAPEITVPNLSKTQ